MKKILITADDYGMCEPVDKAIDECIEAGLCTTTNVILNMETPQNAKSLKARFPHVSVGLHWNVTTGKPLLPPAEISSLADKNGEFYPVGEFKNRMGSGKIEKAHLISELKAQYNAFFELCGSPDYWNTHENSALSFMAFNIFSDIAKENGIPATRNFQRQYIDIESVSPKRRFKEFVHKTAVDIWFGIFVKRDFIMPDARLFPFKIESKFNIDKLIDTLKSSKHNSIEIVIHPATTSEHEFFGNLSKDRLDEYKFFTNKNLSNMFAENGLMLTNFEGIRLKEDGGNENN